MRPILTGADWLTQRQVGVGGRAEEGCWMPKNVVQKERNDPSIILEWQIKKNRWGQCDRLKIGSSKFGLGLKNTAVGDNLPGNNSVSWFQFTIYDTQKSNKGFQLRRLLSAQKMGMVGCNQIDVECISPQVCSEPHHHLCFLASEVCLTALFLTKKYSTRFVGGPWCTTSMRMWRPSVFPVSKWPTEAQFHGDAKKALTYALTVVSSPLRTQSFKPWKHKIITLWFFPAKQNNTFHRWLRVQPPQRERLYNFKLHGHNAEVNLLLLPTTPEVSAGGWSFWKAESSFVCPF